MRVRRLKFIGLFFSFIVILFGSCPYHEPGPIQFTKTAVIDDWLWAVTNDCRTYYFYLYIPGTYNATTAVYPLLVFLHGWGNFGWELNAYQFSAGPLRALYGNDINVNAAGRASLNPHVRDSFVIYPKLAYEFTGDNGNSFSYWGPGALNSILDYLAEEYRIDTKRLYVTGLSFGGGGTWNYGWTCPERPAAIVPIACGLLDHNSDLSRIRGMLPAWAFSSYDDSGSPGSHGSALCTNLETLTGVPNIMSGYPYTGGSAAADGDYTVSWEAGILGPWRREVVAAGMVSYTLYRTGGHDSWTRAYACDALWDWLYAQSK